MVSWGPSDERLRRLVGRTRAGPRRDGGTKVRVRLFFPRPVPHTDQAVLHDALPRRQEVSYLCTYMLLSCLVHCIVLHCIALHCTVLSAVAVAVDDHVESTEVGRGLLLADVM